jgi:hypothetical protein
VQPIRTNGRLIPPQTIEPGYLGGTTFEGQLGIGKEPNYLNPSNIDYERSIMFPKRMRAQGSLFTMRNEMSCEL